MLDFQIRGAAELRTAARQLRIEQAVLRRGASRALERGVRGLRRTIPEGAKRLPGGYATVMAEDVTVSTSVRLAAREPSIAVRVKAEGGPSPGGRAVEAIDDGRLRHPLFGNRNRWYEQAVRPHFASEPFQDARPAIIAEIAKEWNEMVARVERG